MKKVVPLVGYTDKLSARPGETIAFKVSSELAEPYTAQLSQSICADPNPAGLGIVEKVLGDDVYPKQTFESRQQLFYPGSYGASQKSVRLESGLSCSIELTFWPTLVNSMVQTLLCWGDIKLFISEAGCLSFTAAGNTLSIAQTIDTHHWYHVSVAYNQSDGGITLTQSRLIGTNKHAHVSVTAVASESFNQNAIVSIAACIKSDIASEYFNGKIESPGIYSSLELENEHLIAGWDFSKTMGLNSVPAKVNTENALILKNSPARAMTSSAWDASEMCWRHKPEHYQAIHFHEDDIYDFEWDTDFTFTIPEKLPSGIYVMRIKSGDHEDAMPFYVCPPKGTTTAKLCVLIPTFTYSIYGNHARPDYAESWQNKNREWGAYPHNPAEYKHYGMSTYNFHSDGSGICHASHKRPLLNMRPGYITFGNTTCSGLRHFQADSHLISWLHNQSIDYDIITDQQIHDEGVSVLQNYATVATTTHPEYHTPESWNAVLNYRNNGGNLVYLGGNGFYWRIAIHSEASDLLEIRRGEDGIRAWAAEPGEYYHAFDGAYGGLWRRNGKPPQAIVGVGFSAQGQFNGSHYRRVCRDKKFDWVFTGIEGEIIGDFGFSGHGAAGFELDRMDHRLGSPDNSILLASSEAHSDDFILVPEEMLTHLTNVAGEDEDTLLRADIIYFQVDGGGSVFTTGSITFCGSLPHNQFDNNVSRLLKNVLQHMEVC